MKKMKNMNLEGKILIVSGEEEFVRNVNQNIIENVSETEILNCYKILNTEDIARIAENYTVFLNTSGKTNAKENSQTSLFFVIFFVFYRNISECKMKGVKKCITYGMNMSC